jgi:hypothetical protein
MPDDGSFLNLVLVAILFLLIKEDPSILPQARTKKG